MDCRVLYINGKLLKRRYLKWARITHLDIWNTSYGQKKGRESNSREFASFDSRRLKVRNRPKILGCRERATYRWKGLDEIYNFALDSIAFQGLLAKLWGSKVPGVPFGAISGLPLGSPGKNSHLDVASVESCRVYYKGGSGWLPQGGGRCWLPHQGSEVVAYSRARSVCVFKVSPSSPVACPNTKKVPWWVLKGEGGGFPQVRAVVSLVCPCCPWLFLAPSVL
jgi:hypothetical protein